MRCSKRSHVPQLRLDAHRKYTNKYFLIKGKGQPVLCALSHSSGVRLLVTPWTVARLAPLFMGFSRQEYWSGLLCPPPGESFRPRDRTWVSCLLHRQGDSLPLRHLGSLILSQAKKIRQLLACWPSDPARASVSLSSQALLCLPARDSCQLCFRGSAGSEAAYL